MERSLLSNGTLRLNGNLGYETDGQGIPAAVLRTTYTNRFNGVFEPSLAITAIRLNSPDLNAMPGATLQALSVTSSDRVVLSDKLEMKLGSELQTIQFMGRVHAFKPFGSADLHLTPNTVLEYQYASSIPNMELEDRLDGNGLDSASADLSVSETAPRMSMTGFLPAVERAHHQEVSVSERIGKNNMQVAFYSDSFADPVLTGVGEMTPGEMTAESGEVLPDVYSGTFSYQGNDFSTRGMRVVLERKLLSDLTATLDYAYGGVLDLSRPDVQLEDARQWIRAEQRQAVTAKFSGTVPKIEDALDRLLSLHQRRRADAGRCVQYFGGPVRSLPEPLSPPTDSSQLPRGTHGNSHGPQKSSRAGLCARAGIGRTHSLSSPIGALHARRRSLQLLEPRPHDELFGGERDAFARPAGYGSTVHQSCGHATRACCINRFWVGHGLSRAV